MKQVTFTLRTLTPLFLAGAEQTTAELRAPSLRGLMRYWYRALAGGSGADLETIGGCETAVFGATDQGSAVLVKISAFSGEPKEFTEQISVRVGGTWQATGKGYFLWSMARSGRIEKGNLKPARWYFPPGTRFCVTLAAREADVARLKQAQTAFWLLTQLGGIGSRSRRCAGSLAVEAVVDGPGEFSFTAAENAQALQKQLSEGIAEAKKIVQDQIKEVFAKKPKNAQEEGEMHLSPPNSTPFDVLSQRTSRIWILQDEQPWSSPEIAMQKLGEKLQDYRRDIPIERRKIFGLPLPPIIFNRRRSSPLLLRVVELQGKKYVGLAVLFKTSGGDIREEDYQLIEKWINGFRGKLEVIL